ncbi:MAG: RloB domain-containing protein [Lachnospiraceae bacterium]|nr:RloB domain-containing protein [Lachnospiraceae bacterium]
MPRRAKSRNWKKQRKIGYLEKKKHKFYIFCEGQQTEPLYFAAFRELIERNPIYRDMVLIEIIPCQSETMRVIHAAEEYMTEHHIMRGQVWCVYDKDSFPADHFNGVVYHAEKLNQANPELQYHAAWSNECIEFWFILHFAYYTSNNHRSEYVDFLKGRFKQLGLGEYRKNMRGIFDILLSHGNPKLAIRYARRIIENSADKTPAEIAPGTKVYELVVEMAKYLPEDIKKYFVEESF